jgi:hypothetical protein
MDNATRRQILERVKQLGYPNTLEALRNPQVLDQYEQQLQAQSQQQQQQSIQQPQPVTFPTPPATTPNYKVPQPRQSEAKPLVMSFNETAPQLMKNGGPKDKGWREYKTPAGESLYLDPRFKDQRYYVNEKGDAIKPDQNMSLFDVQDNIWESGTSMKPLEVSPRYTYKQVPGALGAMETIRYDLDNGTNQIITPNVMATNREQQSFVNSFNPAGLLTEGVGNIAQGNIREGLIQTGLSIPIVGQTIGKAVTAPLKFAGREVANTYGPALSEAGRYLTTETPLRNAYKLIPGTLKENPEMYLYRARPVGQDLNMNMAAQIRAKEVAGEPLTWYQKNLLNPQTNPQMLAREKYFGQWFEKDPSRLDFYINPGTRNFADSDVIEILRTKLPKSEANKLNVSKFDDAKILSASPETEFILPKDLINSAKRFPESSWQQLLQEDKTFNTPHWLRGYKQINPDEYQMGGKKCYTCNSSKLKVLYNKANYKK